MRALEVPTARAHFLSSLHDCQWSHALVEQPQTGLEDIPRPTGVPNAHVLVGSKSSTPTLACSP
jgi:hypothetical protein